MRCSGGRKQQDVFGQVGSLKRSTRKTWRSAFPIISDLPEGGSFSNPNAVVDEGRESPED